MGKEEISGRVHLLQQLFTGGGNQGASQGLQTLVMDAELVIQLGVCGETSSAFAVRFELKLSSPTLKLSLRFPQGEQ